jgi:hypothetical protein
MKNILLFAVIFVLSFSSCENENMEEIEKIYTEEDNYLEGTFFLSTDTEGSTFAEYTGISTLSYIWNWNDHAYKVYTLEATREDGTSTSLEVRFSMNIDHDELIIGDYDVNNNQPWKFINEEEIPNFFNEGYASISSSIYSWDYNLGTHIEENTYLKATEVLTENGSGVFISIEPSSLIDLFGNRTYTENGETQYETFYGHAHNFRCGFLIDYEDF